MNPSMNQSVFEKPKKLICGVVASIMALSLGCISLGGAPADALAKSSADPIPIDSYSPDGVSHQVTVYADVNRDKRITSADIAETFTYDELDAAGLIDKTNVKGYLYKRRSDQGYEIWNVGAAKNYVELSALLAAANENVDGTVLATNAANLWNSYSTAEMTFNVYNEVKEPESPDKKYQNQLYTQCKFPKSFLAGQDSFFPYLERYGTFFQGMTTSTSAPAVLAFDYKTSPISSMADTTLTEMKTSGNFINNTRFFMGISESNLSLPYNSDEIMGRRFPTAVTAITIYPTGAPATTVSE